MPIRTLQPSFAGGEISPSLSARVDLAKFQVGMSLARNVFVRPHGGVTNRSGTRFVAETSDPTRASKLVPFVFNRDQSVLIEFADQAVRFIEDGAMVTEDPIPVSDAHKVSPMRVTAPDHGLNNTNYIVFEGAGISPRLANRRFRVLNKTADTFEVADSDLVPFDATGITEPLGIATVSRIYGKTTPYPLSKLSELSWLQSADVLYLTHPDYPPHKLTRHDHLDWRIEQLTFRPSLQPPDGVRTWKKGGDGVTHRYVVTAIDKDTGEESLPSPVVSVVNDLTVKGNRNEVIWEAHGRAERFPVYKGENGIYGYIGTSEGTRFRDEYIQPDLTDTPPSVGEEFNTPGNYPSTAAFFEQRLVFAASRNQPQTLWMSRSGHFECFTISDPVKDDDAVTVTLVSKEVNAIRHLVPLDDLMILTAGGEWRLSGTAETGAVGPASVKVRPQSYRGSGSLAPIVVGNTIIFVQRHGAKPRDLGYSFEMDGYTGNDLSVLAPHLFEGRQLDAWAYAQEPHGLIWVVRDDGKAITLTYLREHEVWAWCRQETQGDFVDVATVPENGADQIYLIVRRTVNGRDRYYIERAEPRSPEGDKDDRFLDCGLGYDGPPVTQFGGLSHLEAEMVTVFADGEVAGEFTVTNGAITLSSPVERAWIGLRYSSDIKTLPLDPNVGYGATQGKRKRIGRMAMRVQNTRGLSAGPDENRLVPMKPMAGQDWAGPSVPFTGIYDVAIPPSWGPDISLHLRQDQPLPMTLLGLYPEVTVGG